MAVSTEPARPQRPGRSGKNVERALARTATWFVDCAAVVLVLLSVSGFFYDRQQLSAIATEHLRLIVTGPDTLYAGRPAEFTVSTTSISGQPAPALIETALVAPDGRRLLAFKETADENGRLHVSIPAELALPPQVRLRVAAVYRETHEEIETPLAVKLAQTPAWLTTDKPLYQLGETVHYRLCLLNGGELPGTETPVLFDLLDPAGKPLPQAHVETTTTRGVGSGTFILPKSLPPGSYALRAESPEKSFIAQRCPLAVRTPQRCSTELTFTAGCYTPGEKVTARFCAWRADGEKLAGAKLHVAAKVDDKTIFEKDMPRSDEAEDGNSGLWTVAFELPKKIEKGAGQVVATLTAGDLVETQTKPIPLLRGPLHVSFYPEGGDLAVGLESRVYFAARDAAGHPVAINGVLVATADHGEEEDAKHEVRDHDVAMVETTYAGMGLFPLLPQEGERYRLKLATPANIPCEAEFLPVNPASDVVLSTGLGVFAPGKPLEFNVRAAQPDLPLVAAVYARGVQVGEQPLITKAGPTGANPVAVAVPDTVEGVLRLTIWDYSVSPPCPLAERLVYRRPSQKLRVEATNVQKSYAPGAPVDLAVRVSNEKQQPVSGVLGVSVVERGLLRLAASRTPDIMTYFLLTSEIRQPAELENAAFYLSEKEQDGVSPSVALDLLLGVQGWRRFADCETPPQAAAADKKEALPQAATGEAGPPVLIDNIGPIRDNYDQSLAEYRTERINKLKALMTVTVLSGLGLLLLVVMLGLMRIAWGMHLWIPVIAATVCCLIIGARVIDPSRQPANPAQIVAFQSYYGAAAAPSGQTPAAESAADKSAHGSAEPAPAPAAVQAAAAPTMVRQYAPQSALDASAATGDRAALLYWNPLLATDANGAATVHFTLPDAAADYRVLINAQGDGRIGAGRADIVVQPAAKPPAPPKTAAPQQPASKPEAKKPGS